MGGTARYAIVNGRLENVSRGRRLSLQQLSRLWESARVAVRGWFFPVWTHRGAKCGQPVVLLRGRICDYPSLEPHTCPGAGETLSGGGIAR